MEDKTLFQTPEWEQFRLKNGYDKSYWIGDILVLQKNLPLGRSMLYSPMVNKLQVESCKLQVLKEEIRKIAKKNKSIFYRLEIDIPAQGVIPNSFRNPITNGEILKQVQDDKIVNHQQFNNSTIQQFGFRKAFEEMQPEHTLILDIAKSDEAILAQMKQKGRYNIKIAQRSDLTVQFSNKPGHELDQFYELYSAMAQRHGITYRSKKYFEGLIEFLGQKDYARTYIASVKNDGKEIPLAGVIATYYGDTATYLYGGSADEYRNLMAPYILHWNIITDAKERGYKYYDWFGIAPDDNPKHPWAGVTRFKKQFGGEERHILGSYDLPLRSFEYSLFKLAEKIRRH